MINIYTSWLCDNLSLPLVYIEKVITSMSSTLVFCPTTSNYYYFHIETPFFTKWKALNEIFNLKSIVENFWNDGNFHLLMTFVPSLTLTSHKLRKQNPFELVQVASGSFWWVLWSDATFGIFWDTCIFSERSTLITLIVTLTLNLTLFVSLTRYI